MSTTRFHRCWTALALAAATAPALAQWSDDFDSYQAGSGIAGQGGWGLWDNDPNADSFVTDVQARSAPNSIEIRDLSDTIQQFAGINAGLWEFIAWVYVPAAISDVSTLTLLNQYNPTGPYNWSLVIFFDPFTGLLGENLSITNIPYIVDEWVEIRVLIDLDNDLHSAFYNAITIFEDRSWSNGASGGGLVEIQCLELWAALSSPVYYDDISLTQLGLCTGDLDNDGDTDLADLGILLADFGCTP